MITYPMVNHIIYYNQYIDQMIQLLILNKLKKLQIT